MRNVLLVLLVACGDGLAPAPAPDATDLPDASVDAESLPDAPACWMTRYAQCGTEVYYEVCVPYDGCVYWHCGATKYGYCGPGGVFVP